MLFSQACNSAISGVKVYRDFSRWTDIVDVADVFVVDQASREFGSGNFIVRRIGYSYVDKVRRGHVAQHGLSVDHGSQVLVEP